ncbi:thermonuclease family protein [Eggerthellaceae bacterium 3-80]|nr:hypothetical protein D7W09_06290 [bacterium D16-34]
MARRTQSPKIGLALAIIALACVVLFWIGLQVVDQLNGNGRAGLQDAELQETRIEYPASATWQSSASQSAASQSAAEADYSLASEEALANANPQYFEQAVVERVVDGDTLIVDINGERERVRLVGINAPESVHEDESRNTPEGKEASDHLKALVSEGDVVYLQQDISYTDQYDRRLAYVWDVLPSDTDDALDPATIAAHMINAWQVLDGYAQPRTYSPDTLHDELFKAWGKQAQQAGAGVSLSW